MSRHANQEPTGVLVSGGLDSCVLVAHLLAQQQPVQPIYVRSEVAWQPTEERALRQFLGAIAAPHLKPLVTFDLPLIDLYGDHWSLTGQDVPGELTPDEAVYLPGRNALLLIKPALWCQLQGIERLALAPLAHNPFADATEPFFVLLEQVLLRSGRRPVRIETPFAQFSKAEVLRLGRGFPLGMTFSCLAPLGEQHCGLCNKCAERKRAFRLAGLEDPTSYAGVAQAAG